MNTIIAAALNYSIIDICNLVGIAAALNHYSNYIDIDDLQW